jgi:uncharacterized repeat protein (TIGR01451 family)
MDVRLAGFLTAVMLCGSFEASATVNALSAIGPVGGAVTKILFSAIPNTAFLINNGGLYRSQDGGASWALVEANIYSPMDMALDPADAKRLYVVSPAPASLLVSTDGGVSLSTVASLPSAVTVGTKVVVSQNGATICLANGPQLYCSVDSGQTWRARTPVSSYVNAVIYNLIMDPEDSNSLYVTAQVSAAANVANFATRDGGITWQQLTPTGISVVGVYALAINPKNSQQLWSAQTDGVWMSADRGQTWTNVFSSYVVSIAVDPSNPAVVYVGDDRGHVFRSGNSGTAWTDVTGNLAVGQVSSIAINASQDSQLLVGGTNGVAGSSTAGGVWASQNMGFNGTSITELSADSTTDRIYIASPSSGIFYTANGSGTTVAANNSALAQLQTQSTLLDVGPVLAQPGSVMVALGQNVAHSTDGGNTWSSVAVAQGGDALTALVSAAAAPQVVLAASRTGLYRSSDGGSSWSPITTGLPAGVGVGNGSGPSVGGLYAAQSNPNVFYYASAVQPPVGSFPSTLALYQSMDAGVTWSAKNFDATTGPDAIVAVDPTNSSVLYAAAANSAGMASSIRLLKSADGGATWTPLNWDISVWTQMPLAIAVDPVHPQILYASTIGPLGRSVDGGASWQLFRTTADHLWWNSWSLLVDPKRPETLLVSTAMSGVQEITFEPDLALTVSAPASPVAVGVASSYTYTVANNGPFDATDVTVLVQLPATAQKISATASGGTCSVAAAVASCTFAVLRTAASSSLTVTATAPAAGSFAVTASVSGDQPDPDATNNTVSSAGTVATVADVAVKATGTATSQVGASVTYTLTASNSGPNPAPGTQLTFQLPAGVVFGAVSSTSGTCSGAASLVTCSLGDLATASSATITVNATTAAAGMQTATASITTSATDPVSTNNTASVSTTVTSAPSGGGGGSLSLWVILTLAVYRAALFMREASGSRTSHGHTV